MVPIVKVKNQNVEYEINKLTYSNMLNLLNPSPFMHGDKIIRIHRDNFSKNIPNIDTKVNVVNLIERANQKEKIPKEIEIKRNIHLDHSSSVKATGFLTFD